MDELTSFFTKTQDDQIEKLGKILEEYKKITSEQRETFEKNSENTKKRQKK